MANLDTTIVSTALPTISKEFYAYESYTWVITAYMITDTAIQPLVGKLADIFSGRSLMILFFFIFTISSLLCGVASNIGVLIIGRVIQGIGGGGIISLAIILIADITPLSKRGIYMSVNGVIYALSSVIGPLLGGFFTDNLSWRWSFYINIPVGILCSILFILFFKTPMKKSSLMEKIKRIDFLGTFSLIGCLVCTLIALNWGGTKYSWSSPVIIILLIAGIFFLALYILIEFKFAVEPITPPFLFKYRNITFASITNFFEGFVISVFINTLPLLYQDGRHFSATNAGLRLVPITVFYSFTAMGSGYFIGKWGHIGMYIKYGSFFSSIGAYLITLIDVNTSYKVEFFIYLLYGLSVGVIYQNCILAAQQVSPPEYLGISTTISSFFNFIGGVIGVAIYGTFLQNIYPYCYKKHFPEAPPVTVNNINDVPNGDIIYVEAIRKTYLYSIFPVSILIFLFSLFIKDYKKNVSRRSDVKSNKGSDISKDYKNNPDNIVVTVTIPDEK